MIGNERAPQHSADVAPLRDEPYSRRTAFIVHSHLRWDFVWQRPQQIMSRLAERYPVLFVEEPLGDSPTPTVELSFPSPNLVRAVPSLPSSHDLDIDRRNGFIASLVKHTLKTHPAFKGRIDRFVHWFYSPMTADAMLRTLPSAAAVVYDCMDELSAFRFAPKDIQARERLLLQHADVVFTGGYALYESRRMVHDNVRFFGCGVDALHFGRAREPALQRSPALSHLDGPLLGYVGVIDERLDYALLSYLANALPRCTIVMVGPVAKVSPEELPKNSNIVWLGQRSYTELPGLIKGFDVCLMPFALNEATRFINPTKTLEYMASGKPIVSTAVPDVVKHFVPPVKLGRTQIEFVELAMQTMLVHDAPSIELGLKLADRSSWESIVSQMLEQIYAVLAAKDRLSRRGVVPQRGALRPQLSS